MLNLFLWGQCFEFFHTNLPFRVWCCNAYQCWHQQWGSLSPGWCRRRDAFSRRAARRTRVDCRPFLGASSGIVGLWGTSRRHPSLRGSRGKHLGTRDPFFVQGCCSAVTPVLLCTLGVCAGCRWVLLWLGLWRHGPLGGRSSSSPRPLRLGRPHACPL